MNVKIKTLKLSGMALAFGLMAPVFAQNAKKVAPAKKSEVSQVPADISASTLKWIGKKVTGQHDGKISLKEGRFEVVGNKLVGGSFVIDMSSITVEDIIDDPKTNANLVNHLKNDDFFGVAQHPTSKIVIKNIVALSKADSAKSHKVVADLTIKGITRSVEFPALITLKDGVVNAKGTVVVDRTQFGVKYGSGKFFQNLGDKMINDEFTVDLSVVSQSPAKIAGN